MWNSAFAYKAIQCHSILAFGSAAKVVCLRHREALLAFSGSHERYVCPEYNIKHEACRQSV